MISRKKQPRGEIVSNEHHHSTPRREPLRQNRGTVMRCPVAGCPRQTFRERVPGVLDRYQRRTTRLTAQVSAVARELGGGLVARLVSGLVSGLRVWPVFRPSHPGTDNASSVSPLGSWRHQQAFGLRFGLVIGLIFGLVVGLVTGLVLGAESAMPILSAGVV